MELMQLRRDAEVELEFGDARIMLSARFFMGGSHNDCIYLENGTGIPFMRQEINGSSSLCDYVIERTSERRSPIGVFAVSVNSASHSHEEGCCCPACSNRYEDLIGKTVRMTLAEAASCWLDRKLQSWIEGNVTSSSLIKIIKPAAGYSSCPDHTLKQDILRLLGENVHPHDCHGHNCGCGHSAKGLGIGLTESYAMTPEASICGFIFMHPEARYPDIRRISREQYGEYASKRGMDEEKARRFLGHLL